MLVGVLLLSNADEVLQNEYKCIHYTNRILKHKKAQPHLSTVQLYAHKDFQMSQTNYLIQLMLKMQWVPGGVSMKQDHWSKIKLNLGSALWSKNTINSAGVSSPSVQTCGLFSYCLHFRLWWQSGRHISGVEGLGTGGRWQLSLCSFYSPRGLNCSHCAEWWASLRHFFISV